MQPESDVDVDVLIVGAGPVGLLGGILASRHGLTALVVERRDGPQTSPAAHVVNARTYEICRQAGLDMDRIHRAGVGRTDAGHVNFVTRLGGELIGRLPFERQTEECLAFTPTPLRNLSQHRFEPILVDELRASPGAELRYGHRWERSSSEAEAVVSEVTTLATDEVMRIRSRHVIGCDGAGSGVRASLGIEMVGPAVLQTYLMIHFDANLREVTRDRPAVLHFVLDPETRGTFIAHDVESDWVFMHAVDAGQRGDDFDDEQCLDIIRQAAGVELDTEIKGKGTWRMSSQIAESMGHGRIFLAGDAAHRFPPTGGLGLNSGVQDIHGLMWRIAAVMHGRAAAGLLESYEVERRPVAQHNADESLANAIRLVELPRALGIDLEPTRERLHASLADPDRADAIASAVELQRQHFDLFGLQLGYVYTEGALLPDDETMAPVSASDYVPTAAPGARIPHAWLDTVGGRSTLDLVPLDRPVLVSFGDHDLWSESMGDRWAGHVRVGLDTEPLDAWRTVCGVAATGALLVRPDHHVAWRARDAGERTGLAAAFDVLAGTIHA